MVYACRRHSCHVLLPALKYDRFWREQVRAKFQLFFSYLAYVYLHFAHMDVYVHMMPMHTCVVCTLSFRHEQTHARAIPQATEQSVMLPAALM